MSNSQLLPISNNGSEKDENFTYAMQLLSSSVLPFVLHSTIELNVFEILAKADDTQLSASQIVSKMSCKNPIEAAKMLDRMLYLLATYSLLTCSINNNNNVERLYGLSPVGKLFVHDNEDGASLGPLLALRQHKVSINSWLESNYFGTIIASSAHACQRIKLKSSRREQRFELKDAVLEGGTPFERIHGVNAFEYLKTDFMLSNIFNKAMINHTTLVMKNILDTYKGFEDIKTLVDVGGGLGINLNMITSKYPTIKGINFDLPYVVQHAPSYNGVEHVGGDMFESISQGDAIFMKWILHDWSDSRCVKLLKNCYRALPTENGKLIVVEAILAMKPDRTRTSVVISQFDLIMLVQSPGGKERSQHEFQSLATKAGFKGINFICCVSNFWVMEFYK